MRGTRQVLVPALCVFVALSSCVAGPELAEASDVIAMKRAGTDSETLLMWVQDRSRTFDLDEEDIADLAEAGVSEKVMDAMLERSDEHHESDRSHEHGHQY